MALPSSEAEMKQVDAVTREARKYMFSRTCVTLPIFKRSHTQRMSHACSFCERDQAPSGALQKGPGHAGIQSESQEGKGGREEKTSRKSEEGKILSTIGFS